MVMVVLKVTLVLMVAAAAALTDAHDDLNLFNRKFMLTNSEDRPEPIPHEDCINSCENCACTLIYPPELSRCICLDSTQEDKEEQDKSGAIPYKECEQSCETCACTLVYPPEISKCICLQNSTSQNSGTVVDAELSSGNKRRLIPYPECIQSCKECACTKMWPPQLSQCVCLSNSFP